MASLFTVIHFPQSLYEETHYHKLSLETGNDIFQYKEKPSW